jgi:hypothetical protein
VGSSEGGAWVVSRRGQGGRLVSVEDSSSYQMQCVQDGFSLVRVCARGPGPRRRVEQCCLIHH